MKRVIQCKYSCAGCGIHRRVVSVAARTTENVVEWMENVCIVALGSDHAIQSPTCTSATLSEVMVPIDGKDPNHRVGTVK